MSNQPTLLPEGAYTEAEKAFIELSPPGMWPDNQDTNFGQFRKVVTDIIQECIDEIDHLGQEMFVPSASEYLSQWEEIARVPIAPSGKTDSERRAIIVGRLKYGPFTRARIRELVEGYLNVTFGEAISLTPAGVSLPAGGVPLYSGATDLLGAYRIYEDVRNYAYAVWIKSSFTPDISSLTKELNRITPAGIAVTIDNSKANVLNWHRTIRNDQPVAFYRLNQSGGVGWNDDSGYANHLSFTGGGGPASIAAPGLLHAAVDDTLAGAGDGAVDFDGVDDYFSGGPYASVLTINQTKAYSLETLIVVDAYEAGASYPQFFTLGNGPALRLDPTPEGDKISAFHSGEPRVTIPTTPALGSLHHVVATFDGRYHRIYDNGVLTDMEDRDGAVWPIIDGAVYIGGLPPYFPNMKMDEAVIYNYALSPEQVLNHYKTGINLP